MNEKFIYTGLLLDCLGCAYPTLTLIDLGYDVQVVANTGGSPSKLGDEIALRRMTRTSQLIAELAYVLELKPFELAMQTSCDNLSHSPDLLTH